LRIASVISNKTSLWMPIALSSIGSIGPLSFALGRKVNSAIILKRKKVLKKGPYFMGVQGGLWNKIVHLLCRRPNLGWLLDRF
jgi:hypothetical protein